MSTFPEKHVFDLSESPAGTWETQETPVIDMSQWSDKGFHYDQGTGKAWTGTLQGSVLGEEVWTDVDALTADSDGVFPAYFNYARVKITVAGVIGTNSKIAVAGKVI